MAGARRPALLPNALSCTSDATIRYGPSSVRSECPRTRSRWDRSPTRLGLAYKVKLRNHQVTPPRDIQGAI